MINISLMFFCMLSQSLVDSAVISVCSFFVLASMLFTFGCEMRFDSEWISNRIGGTLS